MSNEKQRIEKAGGWFDVKRYDIMHQDVNDDFVIFDRTRSQSNPTKLLTNNVFIRVFAMNESAFR